MREIRQKYDYWRDDVWLKYVRSLPSCVSGLRSEVVCHHLKGYSDITGSGGSIKGDDLYVIPLTDTEHRELHNIGAAAWEKRYGSQLEMWAKLVKQAFREGVIGLK